MKKLRIGKIIATHALKGELKIRSISDFNDERFKVGNKLILINDKEEVSLNIKKVRFHKGNFLVTFEGLENINLVEKYIGYDVYGYKDDVELDEDEYFYDDLIGCDVYSNDKLLGTVNEISSNGPQDILVFKHNNKKVMIPYVDAYINKVDIENKRIDINLIEGFIDED